MGKIKDKYRNWAQNWDVGQGYYSVHSISARIGKHFCPHCHRLLQIKRKKQVFHSESEEAKKFNYYAYGGNLRGYNEYNWDVYYCASCDLEISIEDMRRYERALKKAGGNVDFDAFRELTNSPDRKVNKRLNFLILCLVGIAICLLLYAVIH